MLPESLVTLTYRCVHVGSLPYILSIEVRDSSENSLVYFSINIDKTSKLLKLNPLIKAKSIDERADLPPVIETRNILLSELKNDPKFKEIFDALGGAWR